MTLAYAISASLATQPYSGYDLTKQFKFGSYYGFFWNATSQQIYRELTNLEAKGWVIYQAILQSKRPDKKIYSLTELGHKQLTNWISQPSQPTAIREELLIKTLVGYLVPRQIVIEELKRRRNIHLKKLFLYQDLESRYPQYLQNLSLKQKCQYLALRKSLRYETDWVDWCDEAIHLLSNYYHA